MNIGVFAAFVKFQQLNGTSPTLFSSQPQKKRTPGDMGMSLSQNRPK